MKTAPKTLAIGLMLAVSLHSAQAAQIAHTYVSGAGSAVDTNACTRSAPCATFQGALANTASGGVITALDAGDYGPVTVTSQSVTIDGTGANVSLVVSNFSGSAVNISAGTNNTVILRHLAITNVRVGDNFNNGVSLNSGNLIVDDCKISGFTSSGLLLNSSGNSVVENTTITVCGSGILTSGMGLVSLRNVTLQGNRYGLDAEGGPVDISHSQITQNSSYGLFAYGGSGSSGTLSASDCMVSGNSTGVFAANGGLIRLTNNDIFNNMTGIDNNSSGKVDATTGTVSTTGNNRKAGNATPGAPTPGRVIAQQ